MGGYDPHFLTIIDKHTHKSTTTASMMKGLLVFSQEAQIATEAASGNKVTKVSIYHISAADPKDLESVVQMAIDFIWRTMHCAVIKVHLHHTQLEGGKLGANAQLKQIFKANKFRWKNLINNKQTGRRVEILEATNTEYKEQLSAKTAFLYRRNLNVADF